MSLVILMVPIIWLFVYNRRMTKQRARGSLTTRYQYHDNVVVLRILLPIILNCDFGIGLSSCTVMWTALVQILKGIPLGRKMFVLFKVGTENFTSLTSDKLGRTSWISNSAGLVRQRHVRDDNRAELPAPAPITSCLFRQQSASKLLAES